MRDWICLVSNMFKAEGASMKVKRMKRTAERKWDEREEGAERRRHSLGKWTRWLEHAGFEFFILSLKTWLYFQPHLFFFQFTLLAGFLFLAHR